MEVKVRNGLLGPDPACVQDVDPGCAHDAFEAEGHTLNESHHGAQHGRLCLVDADYVLSRDHERVPGGK